MNKIHEYTCRQIRFLNQVSRMTKTECKAIGKFGIKKTADLYGMPYPMLGERIKERLRKEHQESP